MCGEYIAILAERQIALFGNKWVLNNNCNLSSWFHVDIMCYIKQTKIFIFRKKWRTAPPKNCRPTVGEQSANCWPTGGRLSFTAFYKNRKKWRTAPPKNCRPTVGQQSANCWPTVYRQSNRLLGELFFTFTHFSVNFFFICKWKSCTLRTRK